MPRQGKAARLCPCDAKNFSRGDATPGIARNPEGQDGVTGTGVAAASRCMAERTA